jgi:hypothetical protein
MNLSSIPSAFDGMGAQFNWICFHPGEFVPFNDMTMLLVGFVKPYRLAQSYSRTHVIRHGAGELWSLL